MNKIKAPKPKFKKHKMSSLAKKAARKVELANAPQYPNRDMSMKGGFPK